MDNDTGNTSSETWQWYRNGVALPGETSQTLVNTNQVTNFYLNDLISCEETIYANNWTMYCGAELNATNMSDNVTILLQPNSNNGGGFPNYYPGSTPSASSGGSSSSGGGSSGSALALPAISTAYNCSTGALSVIVQSASGSPVSDLTVFLEGNGLNTTAITDANGMVEYAITADGGYTVRTMAASGFGSASRFYGLMLCNGANTANVVQHPLPIAPAKQAANATTSHTQLETGLFGNALFTDFAGIFAPGNNSSAAPGTAGRVAAAMSKHLSEVLILLAAFIAVAYFLYTYLSKKEGEGKGAVPEAAMQQANASAKDFAAPPAEGKAATADAKAGIGSAKPAKAATEISKPAKAGAKAKTESSKAAKAGTTAKGARKKK